MQITQEAIRIRLTELFGGLLSVGLLAYVAKTYPQCFTGPMHLQIYITSFAIAAILYMARNSFSSHNIRISLLLASLFFTIFPVPFMLLTLDGITDLWVHALPFTAIALASLYYLFGGQVYLRAIGAKLMKPSDHPNLFSLAVELARKHKTNLPQLAYLDSADLRAFSISSRTSYIVLSVGALEGLDEDGLRIVLEHEFEHLKHNDSLIKFAASLLSSFSPTGFLNLRALTALSKEQEKGE